VIGLTLVPLNLLTFLEWPLERLNSFMAYFLCPYLGSDVELTDEREHHITFRHPDLLPEHRQCIIDTLALPDEIRRSPRFGNARLFSRWFEGIRGGKHVVVVVVSDSIPLVRHWIITAYITRRLSRKGEIEWKRN
jgi:hypothetical protein